MTRNLVVCTDGTWNRPDQRDRDRIVPSNVVKVARALSGKTPAGTEQRVYYDTGVGTGGRWDHFKGGVFGVGLLENVKQAYSAIGSSYRIGDRLFLFGFSRGAYTARSLAGLIGLCGIPDPTKSDVSAAVDSATRIYRSRPGKARSNNASAHVERFSHTTDGQLVRDIHFIGVWDTVGALGVPLKHLRFIGAHRHAFHDVSLGNHVAYAYHALAIDERRKPFAPSLWSAANVHDGQTVKQVWFPGVHSNVGGGYVDAGLSDRTFLWMCANAKAAGLGFHSEYMRRRVDPNLYGELRDSMKWYYKILGPYPRPIPDPKAAAGEAVHWSALQRLEFVTEIAYRNRPNRAVLANAIAAGSPPVTAAMPEEDFHRAGAAPDWNDGGGVPESL
ncbi:MAG: DUF2235 domain-containing protein [bacterium]|nr:DUF2235 domain-containing protein [bacterium]